MLAGLSLAVLGGLGLWYAPQPSASRPAEASRRLQPRPAPAHREQHALRPTQVAGALGTDGDTAPKERAANRTSVPPASVDTSGVEDGAEAPEAREMGPAPEEALIGGSDAIHAHEALGDDEATHEPPPAESRFSRSRRVAVSAVAAWRQPGLCNDPGDAIEARDKLVHYFRHADWDGEPRLFIDPRLPDGAESMLVAHLQDAEREASRALLAEVPRPDVFAYFDTELLLAAACTNDDVVAYYDGALHIVLSHADVRQSAIHEYTHHVLMSRGFVAPTWAQEGIAMNVAREAWWRERRWLAQIAEPAFSLEDMEHAIPYKMQREQALLFYVQSAAMVTCAALGEPDGVAGLVRSLYGERRGDDWSYELPELANPSRWRACLDSL